MAKTLDKRRFNGRKKTDVWQRFHHYTEKLPNGCLKWTGTVSKGQPVFLVEGKCRSVARWLYTQENGELPKGVALTRTCDTPSCIIHRKVSAHSQGIDHLDRRLERNYRAFPRGSAPPPVRYYVGGCPRCGGTVVTGSDIHGSYMQCVICARHFFPPPAAVVTAPSRKEYKCRARLRGA